MGQGEAPRRSGRFCAGGAGVRILSTTVGLLGAGAWGTALAVHLGRRTDVRVRLWARDPVQCSALTAKRTNDRYLPGVFLPESIAVATDLRAMLDADILLAATPMAAVPEVAESLLALGASAPFLWLAKGLVKVAITPEFPAGAALAHQVLATRWHAAVGVISGPSFAMEVARGLPTALTVAASTAPIAARVADLLRASTLRAYESDDITGVETGGAVKNVLAIAAGASDGLGLGHNARAAIITRGLAETGRLSVALGGHRETLMGLSGLGDLVLTCTGDLSRNRQVGLALAHGKPLPAALHDLGHIAEGVAAAPLVRALARHHGIEMPICDAVYRVLYEGLPLRATVESLLRREPRSESH